MKAKIEIESDIPMPDHGHGGAKYPWRTMQVGDSIFTNGPRVNTYHWRKATGFRFKTRKAEKIIDHQPTLGFRTWRIS